MKEQASSTIKSAPKKSYPKRLQAQIHIAKKELAMDDDSYRALLKRVTGKASSKGLSMFELGSVVHAMKELGWKPRATPANRKKVSRSSAQHARKTPADKIRALWIGLHRDGFVQDSSDMALQAFCQRQSGQRFPDWMSEAQSLKTIESLKQWHKRALKAKKDSDGK